MAVNPPLRPRQAEGPAAAQTFANVGAAQGASKIRIADTGDVIVELTPTADIGLSGISFVAEA